VPWASVQDLQAERWQKSRSNPAAQTSAISQSIVSRIESEREEIRQRVANFKAHQQRFIRERKDYAASEWNRMLASQR
jgi:hypothetical protein